MLKLTYYGQNDSVNATPDVTLTGDPGTDQQTLTAAKYFGGTLVGIKTPTTGLSANEPAFGSIGTIAPCNADGASDGTASSYPFATLLNGPGEVAGAIGPAGSKKAPVVRAMWQGNVDYQGYDSAVTFVLGQPLYCGGSVNSNTGLYTIASKKGANSPVVGICTHVPTTPEPWLGVASLI